MTETGGCFNKGGRRVAPRASRTRKKRWETKDAPRFAGHEGRSPLRPIGTATGSDRAQGRDSPSTRIATTTDGRTSPAGPGESGRPRPILSPPRRRSLCPGASGEPAALPFKQHLNLRFPRRGGNRGGGTKTLTQKGLATRIATPSENLASLYGPEPPT